MATDYPGDPAAAQSPSPAPGPENVPIVHLPADGEAANVASANQEWKTLADHIAWLKKPRARLSQWTEAVRRYRNAVLNTRFGIDHMGFPAGRIIDWREDWCDVGFTTKNSAGTGAWAKRWNYYIVGAVPGSIQIGDAPSNGGGYALPPYCPYLGMTGGVSGGANNNVCLVEGNRALTMTDADLECVFEFVMAASAGSGANGFTSAGLATAAQSGDTSQLTSFRGAGFIFRDGVDTNIQAYYRTLSGSATFVDTGVTPGAWRRCRIEVRGSNQCDDAAARVIYYIDGAIVANVAIDLDRLGLIPFFRQWTNGSALCGCGFGPAAFRGNLNFGDSLL